MVENYRKKNQVNPIRKYMPLRFQCINCGNIVSINASEAGQVVVCGNCQKAVVVPESVTAAGSVIGDFVIEEKLGSGGVATVYRAHQISLDRTAALKILHQQHANDPEYLESFLEEARAAAQLNHPHIVQAYAVGEDHGCHYFAMEYVEGTTLKSVLAHSGRLVTDKALSITEQIAEALDFAWQNKKLVHRDIKPDNIILTKNGQTKLADLGLAKFGEEFLTDNHSTEVIGTPQYIAPEVVQGKEVDQRTDIYSLGATLYHVVTGRFPYQADSVAELARKHVTEPLTPPRDVASDIPRTVSDIIERMMAKRPPDRYQSGRELIDDIKLSRENKSIQFTPKSEFQKTSDVNKVDEEFTAKPKLKLKKKAADVKTETPASTSEDQSPPAPTPEAGGQEEQYPVGGQEQQGVQQAEKEVDQQQEISSSPTADGTDAGEESPKETETGGKYRLAFAPRSEWDSSKSGSEDNNDESDSPIRSRNWREKAGSELCRVMSAFLLFAAGLFVSHAELILNWSRQGDFLSVLPLTLLGTMVLFGILAFIRQGWSRGLAGSLAVVLMLYCGLLLIELLVGVGVVPEAYLAQRDPSASLPSIGAALVVTLMSVLLLTGGGKRWGIVFAGLILAIGLQILPADYYIEDTGAEEKAEKQAEEEASYFLVTASLWEELLPQRWELMEENDPDPPQHEEQIAKFEREGSSLVLTVRMLGPDREEQSGLSVITKKQYKNFRDQYPDYSMAYLDTEQEKNCKKFIAYGDGDRFEMFVLKIRELYYKIEVQGNEDDFEKSKQLLHDTGVKLERANTFIQRHERNE